MRLLVGKKIKKFIDIWKEKSMRKLIRNFLLKISGKDFQEYYDEIELITNKEKLLFFRQKYLDGLVQHAYFNVPYYHDLFDKIGIVKNNLVDLSQFERIPVLTKEIIKKEQDRLVSKDHTCRRWYHNSTGGSTGEPTKFMQDEDYKKWRNATNKYFYQDMLKINEADVKKVVLWGSEKDLFEGSIGFKAKVINWAKNTLFLNSFKMSKENIDHYIKIINSFRPDLIRGYAGSLYHLCGEIERIGATIYSPKVITAEAETLTDEMREKIEKVFKRKMYNSYGSRECGYIAGECSLGSMHTFAFANYVEIIKNDRKAKEGEEGKVVITSLHNYSMPFIRYEIGDMAVQGADACECGNPLPVLKKITGRIMEHFLKKDGTVVPSEFFIHLVGVVCKAEFIEKFQVIQENFDRIKILVVLRDKIDVSRKDEIEDKIKFVMGKDCKIVWEFVKEIPKTKSGKYLYTKSMVWGQE